MRCLTYFHSYGPKPSRRATEFSDSGTLICDFKFAPFSQSTRRDKGRSDEEKQLSVYVQDTLAPALLLDRYPKSVIEVFIMVLEDDGGTQTLL